MTIVCTKNQTNILRRLKVITFLIWTDDDDADDTDDNTNDDDNADDDDNANDDDTTVWQNALCGKAFLRASGSKSVKAINLWTDKVFSDGYSITCVSFIFNPLERFILSHRHSHGMGYVLKPWG